MSHTHTQWLVKKKKRSAGVRFWNERNGGISMQWIPKSFNRKPILTASDTIYCQLLSRSLVENATHHKRWVTRARISMKRQQKMNCVPH